MFYTGVRPSIIPYFEAKLDDTASYEDYDLGRVGDYTYYNLEGEIIDLECIMDYNGYEYLFDEGGSEDTYSYTINQDIFFGVTFEEFLAK